MIDSNKIPCFNTRKGELCDGDRIDLLYFNNSYKINVELLVKPTYLGQVSIQLSGTSMSAQAQLEQFAFSQGFDTPINKVHKGEYELNLDIGTIYLNEKTLGNRFKEYKELKAKISNLEKKCEALIDKNYDKVFNGKVIELLNKHNEIYKSFIEVGNYEFISSSDYDKWRKVVFDYKKEQEYLGKLIVKHTYNTIDKIEIMSIRDKINKYNEFNKNNMKGICKK